jgi:hypothetical protein
MKFRYTLTVLALVLASAQCFACSMFLYIDSKTGKIYFVNNEDYFYDVKPYIEIAWSLMEPLLLKVQFRLVTQIRRKET